MTQDELITLAKHKAVEHSLDPALVCAIAEQESSWNTYAMRYEPMFFSKYVIPLWQKNQILGGLTEAQARAFSWGLGQVMGQVARELGFKGAFLSELCAPEAGVEYLCLCLVKKLQSAGSDVEEGLLRYNGGGNPDYPKQVLARMDKYKDGG